MNENLVKKLDTNKKLIKNDKKVKINNEAQTRNVILTIAKKQGCEKEALQILNKYDNLLRNCSNPIERKHISITGITELHELLNVQGSLNIDGMEILPAKKDMSDFII
jgi:hypothetical protein